MIGKLTGRFDGTTEGGSAILDVGGVGYLVRTPLSAVEWMRSQGNSAVSLYIYTAVRDDAIDLYGFPEERDLSFFKQLMSVSGIGPKSAIGVMQVSDTSALKRSIAAGDMVTLVKVFGIGKKSAERIVVELRDKIQLDVAAEGAVERPEGDAEVIEALMALGYRSDESRRAVKDIGLITGDVRERLQAALRQLSSHT